MTKFMFINVLANGAWGLWDDWNDCTKTCGGGTQSRNRLCDNPLPDQGGSVCPSDEHLSLSTTPNDTLKQTDTQICSNNNCPTTTTTPPKGNTAQMPQNCERFIFILPDFNAYGIETIRHFT